MSTKRTPDARVEDYFSAQRPWQQEIQALRKLLREFPLLEQIKWGAPCYSHEGANVVSIGAFKGYFGLWFHQGALLVDTAGVLINAQPGKTKALRQWRMTDATQIRPDLIQQYVQEAIDVSQSDSAIKPNRRPSLELPPELRQALERDRALGEAFADLTPGRQREYANHIAEARRAATRERRLRNSVPLILAGSGLNDRYRR